MLLHSELDILLSLAWMNQRLETLSVGLCAMSLKGIHRTSQLDSVEACELVKKVVAKVFLLNVWWCDHEHVRRVV